MRLVVRCKQGPAHRMQAGITARAVVDRQVVLGQIVGRDQADHRCARSRTAVHGASGGIGRLCTSQTLTPPGHDFARQAAQPAPSPAALSRPRPKRLPRLRDRSPRLRRPPNLGRARSQSISKRRPRPWVRRRSQGSPRSSRVRRPISCSQSPAETRLSFVGSRFARRPASGVRGGPLTR